MRYISMLTTGLLFFLMAGAASAQFDNATTLTYQGYLEENGTPVNDTCIFSFSLWNAATAGTQIGTTQTVTGVTVSDGVFSADLNFDGAQFATADRYIEVEVDCGGGFVSFSPRQPVTAAPLAMALPGLRIDPSATDVFLEVSPNILGGSSFNSITGSLTAGAVVAGGGNRTFPNQVTEAYGVVSGGEDNTASGYASVGGGFGNTASGSYSTVPGGFGNTASGSYSTVPGGFDNDVSGEYSVGMGRDADIDGNNTFVWNDGSSNHTFQSDNRFFVISSDGMHFFTTGNRSTGARLNGGSGTWSSVSDRNVKENLQQVDGEAVLDAIAEMPISTWNYIAQGEDVRHMGPMAQDFHAAFGLGVDDKHIDTIDADGVALAAIQGLYQRVQAQEATIAELQSDVARLDDLETRLAELEERPALPLAGMGSLPLVIVAVVAVWFVGRTRPVAKKEER